MGFFLFILVNATLFIRPAEIIPALEAIQLYYLLIVPCILISLPQLIEQLSGKSLYGQPITAGVLGVMVALILSHLSHLNFGEVLRELQEFPKVILYYLLLAGMLNSVRRIRLFLACLVVITLVSTTLAMVHYHGIVNIPACEPDDDGEFDESTGQEYILRRLCSSGIFHDPNDLCLILVTSMVICLYFMTSARIGWLRPLLLGPLVVFGYALTLTYSRGGFVALLASLLVLFYARFGWKKAIPLGLLAVPAMFVLFGGRQTNLSTSGDTGQERIQLWSAGLTLFRRSPVFGIGGGRYAEELNLVAHNSYVHAFTEMGFFGGTIFLGIYYLCLRVPLRLDPAELDGIDPELRHLRPYLVALVAAYATGMLTISRCYIVPTYLYPGLVSAYSRVCRPDPSPPAVALDRRLIGRLTLAGLGFIAFIHVYVRLAANWG